MTPHVASGADDVEVLLGIEGASCDHCLGGHGEPIRIKDGTKDIYVDVCRSSGYRRAFCACYGDFKTQMVSMPIEGVPVSEGVADNLTCPLCKWTLTFNID